MLLLFHTNRCWYPVSSPTSNIFISYMHKKLTFLVFDSRRGGEDPRPVQRRHLCFVEPAVKFSLLQFWYLLMSKPLLGLSFSLKEQIISKPALKHLGWICAGTSVFAHSLILGSQGGPGDWAAQLIAISVKGCKHRLEGCLQTQACGVDSGSHRGLVQ